MTIWDVLEFIVHVYSVIAVGVWAFLFFRCGHDFWDAAMRGMCWPAIGRFPA